MLGIDRIATDGLVSSEVVFDLETLATEEAQLALQSKLALALDGKDVNALINNAAWQCVTETATLSAAELQRSFQINAIAPLLLFQLLEAPLRAAQGTLINISSVHTVATKAGFGAYAASKAALSSLTRTLALEHASWLKVIELRPGAVATPMLEAGFEGRPADRKALDAHQPRGKVCSAEELAELCVELLSVTGQALTGAVLSLDGGISYRLHDPA